MRAREGKLLKLVVEKGNHVHEPLYLVGGDCRALELA